MAKYLTEKLNYLVTLVALERQKQTKKSSLLSSISKDHIGTLTPTKVQGLVPTQTEERNEQTEIIFK